MKTNAMDRWVWVLIYGGLLVSVLGLFVQHTNSGSLMISGGATAAAVGVVLIYVRSRMKDK